MKKLNPQEIFSAKFPFTYIYSYIWTIYCMCLCIYLAIFIISAKIRVGLILSSSWKKFQLNQSARMILCKICLKVKKNTKDFPVNWTQIKFKKGFSYIFFRGPINLLEIFYPPGSKSVALQLGVHLILLYFIRITLLSAETFFLFWWSVLSSVYREILCIFFYF